MKKFSKIIKIILNVLTLYIVPILKKIIDNYKTKKD